MARASTIGRVLAHDHALGQLTARRSGAACTASPDETNAYDDVEYDGEGHRTKITETPASGAAVVTTFRYQGSAIVAEYKDGVLTREYTVDDAGTIHKLVIPAGQTGAGTYLVTWNGHGDALALHRIESSGSLTLANSYTYSTWGSPTTATHNGIADLGFRFLYVGAYDVQWDGTYGLPLMYMHARTYSPTLGRFLQPDPSRQDAQLFVYAGNGPVSRVDPSGRVCVPIGWVALSCIPDGFVLLGFLTAAVANAAVQTWNYLRTHPVTIPTSIPNADKGERFEDQEVTRLRNGGRWPLIIPRKYFQTPYGGRTLDACAYSSLSAYYARPNKPLICWEFKSSSRAAVYYLGGGDGQLRKDRWLMGTYGFPIHLIWSTSFS